MCLLSFFCKCVCHCVYEGEKREKTLKKMRVGHRLRIVECPVIILLIRVCVY